MFSLEARMAHKGRQGSGAADGSDINRVAPVPSWQSPRFFAGILLSCSVFSQVVQGASKILLHILPAVWAPS